MALATTCPQCKTSFKVVPDQLKLRRGMVRCGMCQNVFSGIDFLRYVDEGPKAPAARPGAASIFSAAAAANAKPNATDPAARTPGLGAGGGPNPGVNPDTTSPTTQSDLKTAFFLPETIFHPTTRIEAPDPRQGPVTVMLPSSLQKRDAPPDGDDIATDLPMDTAEPRDDGYPGNFDSNFDGGAPAGGNGSPRSRGDASADSPASSGLSENSSFAPFEASRLGRSPQPDGATDVDAGFIRRADEEEPIQLDDPAQHFDLGLKAGAAARAPGRHKSGRRRQRADSSVDPSRQQASDRSGNRGARSGRLDSEGSDDAIDYFSSSDHSRHGFSSRLLPLGWVACAILAVALVLQIGIGARNWIMRSLPGTQASFASLLAPLQLRIGAPRDLSSLTIESFELQSAAATPGVLTMSALLRNRAGYDVQWPALELSLTDGNGALLVRKVILPDDYLKRPVDDTTRNDPASIKSKAELPLRLAFEATDLMPSGYTVNLFYP